MIDMLSYAIGKKSGGGGGGGGSSGMVVNVMEEEGTHDLVCDKTWAEMWDAAESGGYIIVHVPDSDTYGTDESYTPWTDIGYDGVEYYFAFNILGNDQRYCAADSADGYPRYVGGSPS